MNFRDFSPSELTQRELFDGAIVALSMTRADTSFVAVNDAYARLFGYDSPRALMAAAPLATQLYVDPADRGRVVAAVEKDGSVRDFEVRMRRRDGAVRWMSIGMSAIRDAQGALIAFHAALFDVTEKRAARERAQLEEQRLRMLIELLPLSVSMSDENGNLLIGSRGVDKVWGGEVPRGPERFDRYKGWWVADGRPVERDEWPVPRVLRTGETRLNDEIEIEGFDGTRRVIRNVVAPIRDAAGKVSGVVAVNEDVTERKREEALLRLEHQVTLRFAQARNVGAALQAAIRAICETEHWEAGRYLNVDAARNVLCHSESWCIRNARRERYLEESKGKEYPPGHGLVGHVWQTGQPLWVPDITQDPRVARPQLARETGMRGSVVFPVHAVGEVLGVFIFDSREIRKPDERLLSTLSLIGGQVGMLVRRAQAEEAMRESEARFRSLTALSADWYWEQDAEFRLTFMSQQMGVKTGRPPGAYLGGQRWDRPALNLDENAWARHRAQLERHEPFQDFEMQRPDGKGGSVWISLTGEPVLDAQGRFAGYRGVGKDITERKRGQEERDKIARMYAALTALNELVARAKSADELLNGACAIAVSSGDFQFALVRLADEAKGVAPMVAYAGPEQAPWLNRPLDLKPESPDAQSLAVRAYREGRPVHASGEALTGLALFTNLSRETGTRAAGGYPLHRGGACVGSLLLNSRDPRGFDGEVGELLERMARNVSQGLDLLQANDELRRFRLAVDQSADMMALVDCETLRYLDVNDTMCKALGYRREELLAMHPYDLLPITREALEASYRSIIEGPGHARLQTEYRRKDGSIMPIESFRSVMRSGGRHVIVANSRDISDRLAREHALLEAQSRFRETFELAATGIAHVGPDRRFLRVNRRLCEMLGYSAEELTRLRGRDISHPDDADVVNGMRPKLYAGEIQDLRLEKRYLRKDGSLVWVALTVALARDAHGAPAYEILIIEDINERKRDERLLALEDAVTRCLAEAETESEGVRGVIREVCQTNDWPVGRYFVADAEANVLRFRDGWGIADPRVEEFLATARTITYAPGKGLSGWVWQKGEPLWVADVSKDARAQRASRPGGGWLSGGAVVLPVAAAGESLGVVSFSCPDPRAPDERLLRSMHVIASQLGQFTLKKRGEEAREKAEQALRGIVHASAEPLLLVRRDGTTQFVNPAAEALFGRTAKELEGAILGLPIADGRPAEVEIVLPGGGVRPAEMQFATTELEGQELLVVSLHDLSERKRYESHIEHLANHDALTSLPNRTLLRDRVEQAIVHAKRSGGHVGLMFVDLDQFKLVNDSWGHATGDMLLLEVAQRLQQTVRDGDTVARLGGDEFVVLLPDLARADNTTVVARKVAETLEKPLVLDGRELRLTASIGIALYPDDGDDLDSLLQCADAAMYRAKDAGRNGYQYYSADMGTQARARVETEAGLRLAIERDELRLHYQPQVDLQNGAVKGFEALMRWEHPTRGMVSPMDFIPVAEESGLILPMGEWALAAACREAMAWSAGGFGSLKVAVNLSPRQFWRGSVTEAVRKALGDSGLAPAQLEIEITESVVARDLQNVMLQLEQLRRMGVSIAIDDFGTGYSSLAYLRSLPINKLKIDKSFIKGIPGDREATALVGEIVRLAHVLSLEVVAEGVETVAQAGFLRAAGCEAMQGYLFARPLSGTEAAALLRAGRRLTLP